ncbi:MAG: hypothetical protein H6909_00940 [Rickettsiaceae bacterium]|nr:hypothetical protein [Rickettsiaceae bacterium]
MAYLLKEHYGNKLAFTSLVTALTITFCLTYNIKYNLYNKTYLGIITVSILSIFVSFAISTMLFNSKTHLKYFFTLGAAALIDGLIMSSYFIGKLDFAQVIMMFSKEALFRTGYITLAMLLVNLIQAKRGFIFNIVPK